jgi:hypothetical protein
MNELRLPAHMLLERMIEPLSRPRCFHAPLYTDLEKIE